MHLTLTDLLFDGRYGDLHEKWVKLFSTPQFRYRDGLTLPERAATAYRQVRAVNSAIDSVSELVTRRDQLMALHEWASVVDGTLTSVLNIHYNLFLGSVVDLDREDAIDLGPFARLERYGTVLITEFGYGSNAANLETTATYRPDAGIFDLHTPNTRARKFMPNTGATGVPKTGLVAARLIVGKQDHGVYLFMVPLSNESGPLPGVHVDPMPDKPGFALDNAVTSFEHILLPRSALLSGEHSTLSADGRFHSDLGNRRQRFLQSIKRVTTGKLCLSAAGIGQMRAVLAIAVRYAHQRRTFAPTGTATVPMFDYRCNQTRLLSALATAYAATFLLREITREELGEETVIAITKGWVTWQTRDIVLECRERCGAQGLLSVNRIADMIMPTEGAITAEGDNLVVWSKAGADMLIGSGYRPPAEPETTTGSLTDCAFLLSLLVQHELHCRQYARTRLRQPGTGAMGRWNGAVNPALDLVSAFAGRRAAQALLAACRRAHGTDRKLLEQLLRLFALRTLAPHTGILLAEGHLNADQVRAVPSLIDQVAESLAPHALNLVEAFAIPEEVLQAPIATGEGGYVDTFVTRHLTPNVRAGSCQVK
jgi:acyl-CoA oxidase